MECLAYHQVQVDQERRVNQDSYTDLKDKTFSKFSMFDCEHTLVRR